MNSKFIGGTMILVGTVIGAGMLDLPTVCAAAGFTQSAILMLVLWLISTITGFLILEVNLALPSHNCSYSSMAEKTLGPLGKIITWIAYLFLLYAIIIAYVMGASDMIVSTFSPLLHIEISHQVSAILFTFILGIAVYWSTQAVDYFNRSLFSIKGFLLMVTLILVAPHIDIVKIISNQAGSQAKYLWLAIPMSLCAFSYHFVLPSLRIYIGEKPQQLRAIVLTGTSVALIIYLWWLAATLGIIPLTGSTSFAMMVPPPTGPIQAIATLVDSKWASAGIKGFSNVALTTSFLGVALGLFDFLADGFKRSNTRLGRLQTAGLTFIPPLLFALFYPHGFDKALNYGAISVAVLSIVLPALMAYRLRQNSQLQSTYRVKCNNLTLITIIIFGLVSIVVAIMYILNLLPRLFP